MGSSARRMRRRAPVISSDEKQARPGANMAGRGAPPKRARDSRHGRAVEAEVTDRRTRAAGKGGGT
ncbi:hypothetical protein I6G79_27610 [Burkholderia plantarii]|nr:hypothetical protein [Burkholderia plantarii]